MVEEIVFNTYDLKIIFGQTRGSSLISFLSRNNLMLQKQMRTISKSRHGTTGVAIKNISHFRLNKCRQYVNMLLDNSRGQILRGQKVEAWNKILSELDVIEEYSRNHEMCASSI